MKYAQTTLILGLLLAPAALPVRAQEAAPTTQPSTQQEVDQLKQRVQALEKAAADAKPVQPANKGVGIKIDGRMFAGVFSTGHQGSFPNRSVDIPDAKIRFTFTPSPNVVIVNRLSTSRATPSNLDYFYVDLLNWGGAIPGHTLRIGKHKIDLGQESWTDNPIESILISNAVSHVSGYDEGINFRGPLLKPATYSVELLNNTKGFNPSAPGIAWAAKVGVLATKKLYVSGNYFHGSQLAGNQQPDFNIAEVFDAPAGAAAWRRVLWEGDVRYNYGPEGISSVVGTPPTSPWQFGATYGQFNDEAVGASDRKGNYWFGEALYNVTPKLYAASRYSTVELDNGATAKLGGSPVAVNRYNRLALGIGYRLSNLTHLRAEYTINKTKGGASEPSLDQLGIGVATKF